MISTCVLLPRLSVPTCLLVKKGDCRLELNSLPRSVPTVCVWIHLFITPKLRSTTAVQYNTTGVSVGPSSPRCRLSVLTMDGG